MAWGVAPIRGNVLSADGAITNTEYRTPSKLSIDVDSSLCTLNIWDSDFQMIPSVCERTGPWWTQLGLRQSSLL